MFLNFTAARVAIIIFTVVRGLSTGLIGEEVSPGLGEGRGIAPQGRALNSLGFQPQAAGRDAFRQAERPAAAITRDDRLRASSRQTAGGAQHHAPGPSPLYFNLPRHPLPAAATASFQTPPTSRYDAHTSLWRRHGLEPAGRFLGRRRH